MATDWAPVIQTGIGAAAAIGGGFVGAWMQGRGQQRLEQYRRRERFAEVLADVMSLLEDINPRQVRFGYKLSDPDKFHGDSEARQGTIRTRLLVLAAGHPESDVRSLARRLDKAVTEVTFDMGMLVETLVEFDPKSPEVKDIRDQAKRKHKEAEELLNDLLRVI